MLPHLSLKYILVAAVATLIAAYAHNLLPEKRHVIAPSADKKLILFFDGKRGGASKAYWDDKHASKAICDVIASDVFPFCGFLLSLGDGEEVGEDFTDYKGVRVSFTYMGPSPRLRIFLRHHDVNFSKPGRVETAKFNNISVPVEDLQKPLYLSFQDFAVAEWWVSASGVPREFSQPEFSNIIKFGFDLPNPVPYGKHELQLNRLELVGEWFSAQQWYLGILIFWLLFIGCWATFHRLRVSRRLALDDARLQTLLDRKDGSFASDALDPLTGAVSRSGFGRVINELYDKDGMCQKLFALVMIDIDGFNNILRRLGHDAGNQTLKDISQIVIKNSRGTDVVCHWSDDRFLVVAAGARGVEAAVFADKIREVIANHRINSEGHAFSVTVSAGVAESSPQRSFQQTFSSANLALAQAKASGKNTVHCVGR